MVLFDWWLILIQQWTTSGAPSLAWEAGSSASYLLNFPMEFPNRLLSVCAVTDSWSVRPRAYVNTSDSAVRLLYSADIDMIDYKASAKSIMIGY